MKLSAEKQNSILDLYVASETELKNTFSLPKTSEEIEEFLRLCSHNKIGAHLFLQLKKINTGIPESLLSSLEETYTKVRSKNIKRLQVGLPILGELKKAGVEVIILKGNAIAEELFGDIGYKPMNDIDILVKREDLGLIDDIFFKNDLLTAAPLEADIRKQEKYSHHWPPFFDKKLDVFLGTHWNIAAPTRGLHIPIEDFWKNKEEFKLMGESYFRLSPKHFILHLCVHLNSAKTGPREIGDLVKVIDERQKDLNVSAFVAMVKSAQAIDEVYEALSLAQAMKSSLFAKATLQELDGLVSQELKDQVQKRITPRHKLLHTRTNYISKIEKTFALFMLTESPLEKTVLLAKMWKLYLLVPSSEALRLNYEFPEASLPKKLMASLFAPIRVSKVFIKDLGALIFVIVTLRHQWVLLKSYGEYVVKKSKGESIKDLDAYAAGLGLTFQEIKEISALD